jgi:hypothetical protein
MINHWNLGVYDLWDRKKESTSPLAGRVLSQMEFQGLFCVSLWLIFTWATSVITKLVKVP